MDNSRNINTGWTGSQIVLTIFLFLFTVIGGIIALIVISLVHQKEYNKERRHQEKMEMKKVELGIKSQATEENKQSFVQTQEESITKGAVEAKIIKE